MNSQVSSQIAFITFQDECGHFTSICKITLFLYEDSNFTFVFLPYYEKIDMLEQIYKTKILIPGIDLQIKRREYIRKNYFPAFLSERTPHNMRINTQMPFVLPWLFESEKQYFGDHFIVTPNEF